jgi:hypothetical protein
MFWRYEAARRCAKDGQARLDGGGELMRKTKRERHGTKERRAGRQKAWRLATLAALAALVALLAATAPAGAAAAGATATAATGATATPEAGATATAAAGATATPTAGATGEEGAAPTFDGAEATATPEAGAQEAAATGEAEAGPTPAAQDPEATAAPSASDGAANDGEVIGVISDGGDESDPLLSGSDQRAFAAGLTPEQKAQVLNKAGMLKGDPDRGLMLDSKLRRSEAVVFFTRLLGKEQAVIEGQEGEFAETPFPDAKEGSWYTPYVSYCVSIGLIAGRDDGKFHPDDDISEKEFSNVLYKILGYEYETDYDWDTVYAFGYDIGLFEDPSYAQKKDDEREYYRRDVCGLVFAVMGLEKKDSPKMLVQELVESGALSEAAAQELGFDPQYFGTPGDGGQDGAAGDGGSGISPDEDVRALPTPEEGRPLSEYADIEAVYHLEKDLLWVVFTKDVTVDAAEIEIIQTLDASKKLTTRVEESTPRDLLVRTARQEPDMEYTINIGNVREADGTNAGLLYEDFVGYNASAKQDTPAGLTTKKRE